VFPSAFPSNVELPLPLNCFAQFVMSYTMSSTRIFPSASTKTEKLSYAVVTRIEMSWSSIPLSLERLLTGSLMPSFPIVSVSCNHRDIFCDDKITMSMIKEKTKNSNHAQCYIQFQADFSSNMMKNRF
jgi:hypothetical protein